MFSRSSLLFITLATASTALAGPIQARTIDVTASCIPNGIEASCSILVNNCLSNAPASGKSSLWHNKSCVAAATCVGVGILESAVTCNIGVSVTNQEQSSLDYNIYAGIVGNCAWAAGGCPITEQNYIDFYYNTLTAIGSAAWPSSSNVVVARWQSIASWTATGNTIPYTNFNDWLHYSTYPAPFISTVSSTPVPTDPITTIIDSSPVPVTTVTSTPVPTDTPITTIIDSSPVPVTTVTPTFTVTTPIIDSSANPTTVAAPTA